MASVSCLDLCTYIEILPRITFISLCETSIFYHLIYAINATNHADLSGFIYTSEKQA